MLVTQESKGQNTNQFESFTISLTLRSLLLGIFQVSRGGVGWVGEICILHNLRVIPSSKS